MGVQSRGVHTGTSSRIRGERPPPRPGLGKEVQRVGSRLGMWMRAACPLGDNKMSTSSSE